MSNNSDHKKPRTNIFELLPEVYRSDVNNSIFEQAFNRHLTKDDTTHFAGYIGQGNPNALIQRQITEPTTYRQAYQLQTSAFTNVGDEERVLGFQGFLSQLELMGVDKSRIQQWGNTIQFNWAPPVNPDMFLNYQNYFWYDPDNPSSRPQYFTIENRCNKARAKVDAFELLINSRGAELPLINIDATTNQFTVEGKWDDLFTSGFVFFTTDTTDVNLLDKAWTVLESVHVPEDPTICPVGQGTTIITTVENIAINSDTAPTINVIGRYWYDTDDDQLYVWSGVSWSPIPTIPTSGIISLEKTLNLFRKLANCACSGDFGWDLGLWDDNQVGALLWNTSLLNSISHATEVDWISANGAPVALDLWYNTTNNSLQQYTGTAWVNVITNFSAILNLTTSNAFWDLTLGCDVQVLNQWSAENKWVHKSQLGTFTGAKRAQVPILEYNSTIELSQWNETVFPWKYRVHTGQTFKTSDTSPTRIELEPIKNFVAIQPDGPGTKWYLYLFNENATVNRDFDYSQIFTTGFTFRIRDDNSINRVFTVECADHRETTSADPSDVQLTYMVTVVKLVEDGLGVDTFFSSYPQGGESNNIRIEPTHTSKGDAWRGYHVHWLLDINNIEIKPTGNQLRNPILDRALDQPYPYSYVDTTAFGPTTIGHYFQEITVNTAGITDIPLAVSLRYAPVERFEVVNVVSGAGGTWTIDGDYTDYFDLNTTFFVDANIGGGDGFYTVASVQLVGSTTQITVNETIPVTSSPSGYIRTGIHTYVLRGSGDLRVFVNDIQQHGNYIEVSRSDELDYTLVGDAPISGVPINYITRIVFDTPLNQHDVVRIEIGPASLLDLGLFSVPVRTVEDEITFATNVASGTQPVYMSLIRYKQASQQKQQLNQYPLFNTYNVCTGEVVSATPLFAFQESQDQPINPSVQRRIVVLEDGTNYAFEQFLVERSNGALYAYRDISLRTSDYWYNPNTGLVKQWNNGWTNVALVKLANGSFAVRYPYVGAIPPDCLLDIECALWYDTVHNKLFKRNIFAIPPRWDEISSVVVATADPTLQTIWKKGLNNEEYIPQYRDSQRNIVPIGDPNGDWELPNQWFYNPEHHNEKEITYRKLVRHLLTVIDEQPDIPGFAFGGIFTLTQNEYNWGLGGTIHDYNHSYDTLISAVNVENTNPIAVIEFAEDQYSTGLLNIRELFIHNIIEYAHNTSIDAITDFTSYVANEVIRLYELNDYTASIYSDTSAFEDTTNIGIQNWIATVPMFGLGAKFQPLLHIDNRLGIVQLLHHDGHRSDVELSVSQQDILSRQIVNMPDPRIDGQTYGVVSSTTIPSTRTLLEASLGDIRAGVYWYRVSGSIRELYRLNIISAQSSEPSPVGLNDGVYYYNTLTNTLYVKSAGVWQVVSSIGDEIITSAWTLINLKTMLGQILLEVEQRLYDVSPDYDQLVFDFDSLTSTPTEQNFYNQYQQDQFNSFLQERNITTPFKNTTYNASNAFTWNYAYSVITTPPTLSVPITTTAASWQQLYTLWYGTPYPHLEPWRLQGYPSKPMWWDSEYKDPTETRRWLAIMWTNILSGTIPGGYELPPIDVIPTYQYVSVNISGATVGPYEPDDLFPPYFNTVDPVLRSFFTNLEAEIVTPNADYLFGDFGPVEWAWTTSSESVYDPLIIAFRMQPARFLHNTFGPQFVNVNGLQVETRFCKVYSHEDALFHGDIYNNNEVYLVRGLNQWYVNYNRYTGEDTSRLFRPLWVDWDPQLSYFSGGILDTELFEVSNRFFDVAPQDFNITLANIGVIKDLWADAYKTTVLSVPPTVVQTNNEGLWKFQIDTLAAFPRTLHYYPTKRYGFTVDVGTNIATAFRYDIIGVDIINKAFHISGDFTDSFEVGESFVVSESSVNNGTYTVRQVVFNTTTLRTEVYVTETIPNSGDTGVIDQTTRSLPWQTGDLISITSSQFLPAPLVSNQAYYIIALGNRDFQIAVSTIAATSNNPIVFSTTGSGELRIGEVSASFRIFGGSGQSQETWYHFALDKTQIKTLTSPFTFSGIQRFIDLIDGLSQYQEDQGIRFNLSTTYETDLETGRAVNWQTEIEHFIDWAYGLRRSRLAVNDRYSFNVSSTANDELTFNEMVPNWAAGTAIVFSTTGTLPTPLIAGVEYYYAPTATPGVFNVSTSRVISPATVVDITDGGSGTIFVGRFTPQLQFPTFEINPLRNNLWIDTPQGILSDIVDGPFADIRVDQTIFDQYGRRITTDKLLVYRQDEIQHIQMVAEVPNDVQPTTSSPYLHMGGGHFFLEGYEHVVRFNNYTTTGQLMYDPFIGVSASKFNVDFYRKAEYTLRPTLGGYYLQSNNFYRNIEGQIVDSQLYYDTFRIPEARETAKRSRALIGYTPRKQTYLDLLDINNKTQFMFYRGMIQYKGSVSGIKAYVNSKRFVDAKIDEFWAWKIAEFGDSRPKVYPKIKLFSTDGVIEDVRLEFLTTDESQNKDFIAEAQAEDFEIITLNDSIRWYEHPDQKTQLKNSVLFLDAEITSLTSVYSSITPPLSGQENKVDYWYDLNTNELKEWNGLSWNTVSTLLIVNDSTNVYWKLNTISDGVRVIRRRVSVPGDLREYTTGLLREDGDEVDSFSRVNSEVIRFEKSAFVDWLLIFTVNIAKNKLNPAKIIDEMARTVITNVPLWHPALGHHYHVAAHNIDLFREDDPALYTSSLNVNNDADRAWNNIEVGTRWLDTSRLGYLPYYDDKINPNVTDRLFAWGNLADWSTVKVFEWTESRVPADQYSQLVLSQQGNLFVPRNEKATGVARTTQYKRTRIPNVATIVNLTGGYQEVDVGGTATMTSATGLVADNTAGYQEVLFSSPVVGSDTTGYTGTAPFTATIFIDGVAHFVSVSAVSAATITTLLNEINNDLLGYATAAIVGNNIRITSNTLGINSSVIIVDINLFNTINGTAIYSAINPSVSGTSGTLYTAVVSVDGVNYTIEVDGDAAVIYSDLLTVINEQLPTAIASLVGGNVRITSNSVGVPSTISITDTNLFGSLAGFNLIDTAVDGTYGQVQVVGNDVFSDGDEVLFVSDGTLPFPLQSSVKYTVVNAINIGPNQQFDVREDSVSPVVEIVDVGTGLLQAVPAFKSEDWVRQDFIRQRFYGALELLSSLPTITTLTLNASFVAGDLVNVHVNGKLVQSTVVVDSTNQITITPSLTLTTTDIVDVVRPIRALTEEEQSFDPDTVDDGTINVQYNNTFEQTQITSINPETGVPSTLYYFWVENATSTNFNDSSSLSTLEVANQLENIPVPYLVLQKPLDDPFFAERFGYGLIYGLDYDIPYIYDQFPIIPIFYRQAVLRKAADIINDDDRYTLQFTRDFTLRDTLENGVNLKNKHEEWTLIREQQNNKIDRTLWNRLIECIVGFKLDDNTVRVPSLERELYDATFATDTRYGLGDEQAFGDGNLALQIVINHLLDSTNDLSPIDIDTFLAQYSFDTADNIITAMNVLYEKLSPAIVNKIWFGALKDAAFTVKSKYKELFKTSWVALHNTQILDVGGLFDE